MKDAPAIAAFLDKLPADQRRAIEKVRKQIKAAAPAAEEYFGYGMLGFKWQGHPLIYVGAAKSHCALYGARADAALAKELADFKQSKGTIQFTPDKPIPAKLVARIVKARMVASEQRWKKPAKKKLPAKRAAGATKRAPAKKSKLQSAARKKRVAPTKKRASKAQRKAPTRTRTV